MNDFDEKIGKLIEKNCKWNVNATFAPNRLIKENLKSVWN